MIKKGIIVGILYKLFQEIDGITIAEYRRIYRKN